MKGQLLILSHCLHDFSMHREWTMNYVIGLMLTLAVAGSGEFRLPASWEYSAPLISPEKRDHDQSVAQKDPSVVCVNGRWHVFMTVKLKGRTAIEYCSFDSWNNAGQAPRTLLKLSPSDYFCAPQVFYFAPHAKWYLIYQVGVADRDKMWVAYSTTTRIDDPASWTQAQPMLDGGPQDPRPEGGLDFWIICDQRRAWLFFTSLNGKLWRAWTELDEFPRNLGHVELALQGSFYEASHTYAIKGTGRFLTLIEEDGRRYYKAYIADSLGGAWTPLAVTAAQPFAGAANIRPAPGVDVWTDNVSHGELVRDGYDETMTVDPGGLRFVFQGMLERDKGRRNYGQFQWRIGILTPRANP
jgi:hypothetical protein